MILTTFEENHITLIALFAESLLIFFFYKTIELLFHSDINK